MALLASYHLPGLAVEDHAIDVPLDWRGTSPARLAGVQGAPTSRLAESSAAEKRDPAFEGRSLRLFYRVMSAPENRPGRCSMQARPLSKYTAASFTRDRRWSKG